MKKSVLHLEGKLLLILPQDVTLIMGLNKNGEKIQVGKKYLTEKCELLDKYFDKDFVGMRTLEKQLKVI